MAWLEAVMAAAGGGGGGSATIEEGTFTISATTPQTVTISVNANTSDIDCLVAEVETPENMGNSALVITRRHNQSGVSFAFGLGASTYNVPSGCTLTYTNNAFTLTVPNAWFDRGTWKYRAYLL